MFSKGEKIRNKKNYIEPNTVLTCDIGSDKIQLARPHGVVNLFSVQIKLAAGCAKLLLDGHKLRNAIYTRQKKKWTCEKGNETRM